MVIKSKGWTARPLVKIVSFVLITVLVFAFISTGISLDSEFSRKNIDLGLVFASNSNNQAFLNSYMDDAVEDLEKLLFYQNEENIRDMGCLKWVKRDHSFDLIESDGSRTWNTVDDAQFADLGEVYPIENGEAIDPDYVNEDGITQAQIEMQCMSVESNAINNQLRDLFMLKEKLQRQYGLIYYVSKPNFALTNVDTPTREFFAEQPAFIVIENGLLVAQSTNRFYSDIPRDNTIYAAFTVDFINAQSEYWSNAQGYIITGILAIVATALFGTALFLILLCGAGRKRFDCGEAVHFSILDKPYLDIGLVILATYLGIVASIISDVFGSSYNFYIPNRRTVLTAIAAVLLFPPALCYVLSFAKRVKAGKWWRHTLIWRICNRFISSIKSLWAGVPLTLRVTLIGLALFFGAICVAAMGSGAAEAGVLLGLLFTAIAVVFMLRFASKLHKLEQAAKAASLGNYDAINVRGGDLGSIADSINNISSGINTAVEQRLKSERLKTELITNVSHDIRTPLTSIITYTDLLKSEGLTCEKAPEYLDILIQKSQRLKTLTDELFEAAKAATGNIDVHIEAIDFSALIKQVLGELDERITSSGLDFRLNLPERAWILGDGKLLWRVVENLLSNVFKYALPQSRVYIDVTADGDNFRLEIKNISAQALNLDPSELTERFKRGDSSRSSEGSGLGLSIVQSFVDSQKGRFVLTIDGDLFKAIVFMPATETNPAS